MMARMAILPDLVNSVSAIIFTIGKIIRFLFFFIFLFAILSGIGNLAGYSREEVIWFFLAFNLVDVLIQFVFRGVYHFRFLVAPGNFDIDLLKPLPSYFRPLFGHVDILDFITLIPLIIFSFWFAIKNQLIAGSSGLIAFLFLLGASFLFGFAFHLLVCSITILTLKIDHLIWIYRDLTAMAQFPTDIYRGAVRFVLTFIFPVVLLITFPAKGLLGLLSWKMVLFSLVFGIISAYLSLKFWHWSLKRYTSASS